MQGSDQRRCTHTARIAFIAVCAVIAISFNGELMPARSVNAVLSARAEQPADALAFIAAWRTSLRMQTDRTLWLHAAAERDAAMLRDALFALRAIEDERSDRVAGLDAPRRADAAPGTAVARPASPPVTSDSIAATLITAINRERAARRLAALGADGRLATAASAYARLLAGTGSFSHTGPDGSTFPTRIAASGYPAGVAAGEVLALGTFASGGDVVSLWMQSAPHRTQLLGAAYAFAGAGCAAAADGALRCVVIFAGAP